MYYCKRFRTPSAEEKQMFSLFAEALPQPVSEPVHYSAWSYALAYFSIAAIVVCIVLVLRKTNPALAKPQVLIIALLLSMLCLPMAIIYLVVVAKDAAS